MASLSHPLHPLQVIPWNPVDESGAALPTLCMWGLILLGNMRSCRL